LDRKLEDARAVRVADGLVRAEVWIRHQIAQLVECQGIFTPSQFFSGIEDWFDKSNPSSSLLDLRKTAQFGSSQVTADPAGAKDHFTVFKTAFTGTMLAEAAHGNHRDQVDHREVPVRLDCAHSKKCVGCRRPNEREAEQHEGPQGKDGPQAGVGFCVGTGAGGSGGSRNSIWR
jgi:hypothetical protein